MNKKIAKQWVAALRSGDFKQGEGRLESNDGQNCCLGVLCNLAMLEGVCDYSHISNGFHNEVKFDGKDEFLPRSVKDWAGMKSYSGKLTKEIAFGKDVSFPKQTVTLAQLNDGDAFRTRSFNEIADLIEKNWEIL